MKSHLHFLSQSFALLIIALLMPACNESKHLMKDASILEQGGLRGEALEKYRTAYNEYNKAEALVGMRRNAQYILDSKHNNAQMLCMSEKYEEALVAFEDAFAYKDNNKELELSLPMNATDNYKNCRNNYITMLAKDAEQAIFQEDFSRAQQVIQKLFQIDRRNEKAKFLDLMCEVIPNYNAGKKAMELGLWRDAWIYFNEVCMIYPDYKDAVQMRDECLAKGTFAVAYIIKDNKVVNDNIEQALSATVKGELLKSKNPFLELLERENLDVVLQEQQQTLSPQFDTENGHNLGKLKRAQFILSGELVYFKSETTPLQTLKCDCASNLGIYSDKVTCFEITQTRKLNASFKYQLIDAETGKLYQSDVIAFADEDHSKKYDYEIQKKFSLVSPLIMKEHEVNLSGMKNLTPDVLLTEQDLLLRMYASFADKIASALSSFNP